MLLAGHAVPAAAAQGGREDDRVCFYRDVQYQGQAWCYRPGDELADLRDRRNQISSLRIFYGHDCRVQPIRTGGPGQVLRG